MPAASIMENQSLFALIPPAPSRQVAINDKVQEQEMSLQSYNQRAREVQVTGEAEVCCPADRVSVRISVGSSKESVNEATTSVQRRLEYILQSIR